MYEMVLFGVKSFAGEDVLQFSTQNALQLSMAKLLSLKMNNNHRYHDHGLRAAAVISWPLSALPRIKYFKGNVSFNLHHNPMSYVLPIISTLKMRKQDQKQVDNRLVSGRAETEI